MADEKISVKFSALEDAINNSKKASSKATKYAEVLRDNNLSKLDDITGGCNGHVYDARQSIKKKVTELESISTKFTNYATALEKFEQNVRDADSSVKDKIDGYAKTFSKEHNIETGPIEAAWNWLCDGVSSLLNQTELGQWINNALRKVGDWFGDRWDDFKEWYALEGGQFWVNIGLGLLAIAAAVFTILTAGVGFLAVVAIIGAVITIVNAVVQIGANIAALVNFDEDPAWSRRCGKISKLSQFFSAKYPDNKFLNFVGKAVDVVDAVCTIISFTDFATKTYSGLTGKTSMFQRYLGQNGVLDAYFVVDNGTDAQKALRQFNAFTGQWERLDESGKVVRNLATGEVMTVEFSKAGSGFEWDFKTGIKNLFGGEEGLKGYQVIKGKFSTDMGVKFSGMKTTFSSMIDTISDIKTNGFKSTLKDIHMSSVKKHYGKVPSIGDAKAVTEKLTAIKAKGAIAWGKTTETGAYIFKNLKSGLGFESFGKDAKAAQKIELTKTTWGKAIYSGEQLNNAQKTFSNIGKFLSGNYDEIYKPVLQINKFFGSLGTLTGSDSTISVGNKSSRYDNWNQILHRNDSGWTRSTAGAN